MDTSAVPSRAGPGRPGRPRGLLAVGEPLYGSAESCGRTGGVPRAQHVLGACLFTCIAGALLTQVCVEAKAYASVL